MADTPTPPRRSRFFISANVLVQIIAVFVLMVMINYLASRHYIRFDWTKSGYFKVSGKTQLVLSKLTEPVRVIVYLQSSTTSELDSKIFEDVRELLSEFKFYGKDKLRIEFVDPYRDKARASQIVEEYKIGTREPALVIFACGSQSKYVSREEMADIEQGGYTGPSRILSFKAEGAFLSAIQNVTEGHSPTVCFLTGHGEPEPDSRDANTGLSMLSTYLKRDNLTVRKCNLQDEQTIPTNAAAVVIIGPRTKYSGKELQVLEQYLKDRGRLIVMLDAKTDSGLEPLLTKWGVQVDNDMIVRKAGTMLGTELIDVNAVAASYAKHPITERLLNVNTEFPYARSVHAIIPEHPTADQPRVVELAKAGPSYWGETNPDDENVSYNEGKDKKGPLPLAVAVESGQPRGVDVDLGATRLVVFGTAGFVENSGLTQGNLDFFMSSLNWLLKREQLMAVSPKAPEEFRLGLNASQMNAVFWLIIGGLPMSVAILGTAVWLRRRR